MDPVTGMTAAPSNISQEVLNGTLQRISHMVCRSTFTRTPCLITPGVALVVVGELVMGIIVFLPTEFASENAIPFVQGKSRIRGDYKNVKMITDLLEDLEQVFQRLFTLVEAEHANNST